MKYFRTLSAFVLLCIALAASNMARAATYILFAPPGNTLSQVIGVNSGGKVVGNLATNPFIYDPWSGAFTTFVVPVGEVDSDGASAYGMNDAGTIVGQYRGAGEWQGFIRAPDGTVTTYRGPFGDASTFSTLVAVNNRGDVVGYTNPSINKGTPGSQKTFVSFGTGGFKKLFDPDAPLAALYPTSINDAGAVCGKQGVKHFVQTADGKHSTYTIPYPGVLHTQVSAGINSVGSVVGYGYSKTAYNPRWGQYITASTSFIRGPDGQIQTFNVEEGGTSLPTYATAIISSGTTAGYFDSEPRGGGTISGFIRDADGIITKFNVPGMVGVVPRGMTESEIVAGIAYDAKGFSSIFVRLP